MRILHFEYSDFFRQVVHDMSSRLGFDYTGTSRGEDFMKLISKHEVDVIITGMELSDMKAETLIANIKSSKYNEVPIVILTSLEIDNIHKRLKELIFNDFILKESLNVESFKKCMSRFDSTN